MDSSGRQNHALVAQFNNNIKFSQLGILSSFLKSCLDVVEQTHQMIANPKSHCAAHYLRETENQVNHLYTFRMSGYSKVLYSSTCMMSMMTVRFLSWVGPSNFKVRFIMVILLHSIKSSSPSWLCRTSCSFNNSATC